MQQTSQRGIVEQRSRQIGMPFTQQPAERQQRQPFSAGAKYAERIGAIYLSRFEMFPYLQKLLHASQKSARAEGERRGVEGPCRCATDDVERIAFGRPAGIGQNG